MNEGNSDSVPLVSVGLPSRETEASVPQGRASNVLVGSGSGHLRGPALLVHFGGAQANWIGDNSQGASGRCALRLEGRLEARPIFFLGNSGVVSGRATGAAARAWTCDSDKLRDNMTAGLCRGVNGVSSLKSALAGVGVNWLGGRMVGKR